MTHCNDTTKKQKSFFILGTKRIATQLKIIIFRWLNLFADMRMSSSMYEVFNWNSSPDHSLTQAKNKRASLSLPPTTDIFAIDDKSDCDTRRATVQRTATGESPITNRPRGVCSREKNKNFHIPASKVRTFLHDKEPESA